MAHFTIVTRLDPARESAWKHLGFKKYNGKWMSESRIAAVQAEAEAQRQADRRWQPLLERWRAGSATRPARPEAEARLAEVSDPRAVPAIWAVFGSGNSAQQRVAAGLLAQIDGAGRVAGPGRPAGPGEVAGDPSRPRPRSSPPRPSRVRRPPDRTRPRPLKYEVKPVGGPGSPGVLFVEGERYQRPAALPDAGHAGWHPGRPESLLLGRRARTTRWRASSVHVRPVPARCAASTTLGRPARQGLGAAATRCGQRDGPPR